MLQVEFNLAKVKGCLLIGYENRALRNEDLNKDKKDAGDSGSVHTVTTLYEIIPPGTKNSPYLQFVNSLKYQQSSTIDPAAYTTEELLTLKLRYKKPDGAKSSLIEEAVYHKGIPLEKTSDNFRFSAAVASFGMLCESRNLKEPPPLRKCWRW